jgi:hypothetical protein
MSWHLANSASQKRYRTKHNKAIAEQKRKYYKDNKEAIAEQRKRNRHIITKEEEEEYIKSKYSFCFNKE